MVENNETVNFGSEQGRKNQSNTHLELAKNTNVEGEKEESYCPQCDENSCTFVGVREKRNIYRIFCTNDNCNYTYLTTGDYTGRL